ncbi:MAG: hypothetical protein IT333_03710, partial [Thermomicrobiales bacterium]|nr:hypothetical protein [Thermomicrobiales bacterium]
MAELLANPAIIVSGVIVSFLALIVGGWSVKIAPGATDQRDEDAVRRIARNSAV